jgi:hypothetical protein
VNHVKLYHDCFSGAFSAATWWLHLIPPSLDPRSGLGVTCSLAGSELVSSSLPTLVVAKTVFAITTKCRSSIFLPLVFYVWQWKISPSMRVEVVHSRFLAAPIVLFHALLVPHQHAAAFCPMHASTRTASNWWLAWPAMTTRNACRCHRWAKGRSSRWIQMWVQWWWASTGASTTTRSSMPQYAYESSLDANSSPPTSMQQQTSQISSSGQKTAQWCGHTRSVLAYIYFMLCYVAIWALALPLLLNSVAFTYRAQSDPHQLGSLSAVPQVSPLSLLGPGMCDANMHSASPRLLASASQ